MKVIDKAYDMIVLVANSYEVPVHGVLSRSKAWMYAKPRRIAMYLIRKYTPLTFPAIGELFDRHHSTVITAIDTVESERHIYTDIAVKLMELEAKCQ
jgi:chromosomal replication initiator protein